LVRWDCGKLNGGYKTPPGPVLAEGFRGSWSGSRDRASRWRCATLGAGVDRYACKATDPLHARCDDSVIAAQARQAEADGVREYWGVVGAFFDG
jgi:hypothetical protein